MTTKEILQAARNQIANPKNWTQGDFARDAEGKSVEYRSTKAVSFCMAGALFHVAVKFTWDRDYAFTLVDRVLSRKYGSSSFSRFNDTHTHEEVLAVLDEAIAAA